MFSLGGELVIVRGLGEHCLPMRLGLAPVSIYQMFPSLSRGGADRGAPATFVLPSRVSILDSGVACDPESFLESRGVLGNVWLIGVGAGTGVSCI